MALARARGALGRMGALPLVRLRVAPDSIRTAYTPNDTTSPGRSRAESTRTPFRNVPFREPRSRTKVFPSVARSSACRRETVGSGRLTSHSVERPTTIALPGSTVASRVPFRSTRVNGSILVT